jgi:hypothetical protein
MKKPSLRARRLSTTAVLALASLLVSCGGSGPTTPEPLPDQIELISPTPGEATTSTTPVFTVANARGFDEGEAEYTFRVSVASTDREVATTTVRAGRTRTSAQFAEPLLSGATLAWRVSARSNSGSTITSAPSSFRLPAGSCVSSQDPFAKRVVDWWISVCTLALNLYTDPSAVLGAPDGWREGPDTFSGMVSLGSGGWVTVDMEACAVDGPGDDVKVYQTVSAEPVTLYAGSNPTGPWVLVEPRKPCGDRARGHFSRACTFDLAQAGLEEARYFKIEDGELYPCPGGSTTDGADIDAIEILNQKP